MKLFNADCVDILKRGPANSVDSMVTDPPAGISFMGKAWDDDKGGRDQWQAWMTEVMKEALRVMKPGAHGLVWAIPRTSHWTATALENAGFEIRDVVTHLFGTGFPKSLNVGKQTGKTEHEGLGTALKPASEHWILVRKPCSERTVAANVLKWGTGALNIDASRIASPDADLNAIQKSSKPRAMSPGGDARNVIQKEQAMYSPAGRFPANLVLDEEAAAALDAQSGVSASARPNRDRSKAVTPGTFGGDKLGVTYSDSGGASRFFFVHKDYQCNANTVKLNSNLQKELDVFAQGLAAISERPDTNLNSILLRFTLEMQNELKNKCEINIETFLTSVERCSQELWHTSMSRNNLANVADNQMLIDTTRTIQNLLMSDSFAEAVTFSNTLKLKERGDLASVNRFLYVAKASKADKNEGLEDREAVTVNDGRNTPIDNAFQRGETARLNTHPTVKSTALMEYLIKLITPPGGKVLDPFMGSGSTGKAALNLGFDFVGIEKEQEYFEIAKARIEAAQ